MNRWYVYSFIKYNYGEFSTIQLKNEFPGMDEREIEEGILEWLSVPKHVRDEVTGVHYDNQTTF